MNPKPLACFLLPALFAWACHSRSGATGNGVMISDSVIHKIEHSYSGKFNKGLISVVINYISGNTVSGYDVHAGQRRNLNGEVTQQGKLLSFVLKEPGGNPTDGTFRFVLDLDSVKLIGKWTPLDTTKASAHEFVLVRGRVEQDYDEVWGGVTTNDTLLTFKPDGTCILAFYQNARSTADSATAKKVIDSNATAADSASSDAPENPADQLISIRGNYTKAGLTYKIDWEKNLYFPSHMTLIKELRKDEGSTDYYPVALKGNGFTFAPTEDD